MRRPIHRLINAGLSVVFLAAALLVLVPAVLTSSVAAVYTGSMEPAMPVGSLAVVRQVKPSEIVTGDIIAFNPPWEEPDVMVSHRVIEVVPGECINFRTKGDANKGPDLDYIPETCILGKVDVCIPNLGYVISYVARYSRTEAGFVLLVGVPTVLLVGSAFRDFRTVSGPGKRRMEQRMKLQERRHRRRRRWWAVAW